MVWEMNSESIPLTSIIIPTYNCAKYVCDSINSALRQIHPNIEIIVVDDGSNDDTSKILEKYNNKIRYIYQPNKGLPAARNAGLRVAQGIISNFWMRMI